MKANEALSAERKRLSPSPLGMGLPSYGVTRGMRYKIGESKENSPAARMAGSVDPGNCPMRQRLLDEYNRRFKSWVAHEDEGKRPSDAAESERLALARLEGAHQKLLQHQQSCAICKGHQTSL